MNIALIGTTLFHQGAEYVLAVLARGLSARGHRVTVVLSRIHDDWQKSHPSWRPFELGPNVNVIIQSVRRARASVFSLYKIIVGGHYDVVISQSSRYTYTLGVITYFLKRRPIFIHVEHSGGIGTDLLGNLVRPKWSIKACVRKWLFGRMDAQFAVSDGTADAITRMTGFPREHLYTVYNPVVDEIFFEKIKQSPSHKWFGDTSLPVVVAAGAFCSLKNYQLLLRAWAEVVKKCNARLIIFGEGPLRSEYERLISEFNICNSVSLPGFTDNLPAALKRASCFVVSSTVESFSIVLVEALAAGVPVVSTDCPYGPGEILRGGKYGILVKNNDVQALSSGILTVLQGGGIPPSRESFKAFTAEAVIKRYEHFINEIQERREYETS